MFDYDPPADLLKDRVILITGAGDGIGRTVALTYARHGATTILLSRSVEKLEQLSDEIANEGLPEPGLAPIDLERPEDMLNELAAAIHAQYGRLDGLLHNASILGERVPFEQYNPQIFQRVMQVNATAVFQLTQAMLPLLRASEDARLLFTSSSVGAEPRAYWGAYSVSKYAMEGFAKLLMDELENTSPVRVNIINPGATRTAMRRAAYPAEDPATVKSAGDLMPLYLYLAGPDSAAEHGKTFKG